MSALAIWTRQQPRFVTNSDTQHSGNGLGNIRDRSGRNARPSTGILRRVGRSVPGELPDPLPRPLSLPGTCPTGVWPPIQLPGISPCGLVEPMLIGPPGLPGGWLVGVGRGPGLMSSGNGSGRSHVVRRWSICGSLLGLRDRCGGCTGAGGFNASSGLAIVDIYCPWSRQRRRRGETVAPSCGRLSRSQPDGPGPILLSRIRRPCLFSSSIKLANQQPAVCPGRAPTTGFGSVAIVRNLAPARLASSASWMPFSQFWVLSQLITITAPGLSFKRSCRNG